MQSLPKQCYLTTICLGFACLSVISHLGYTGERWRLHTNPYWYKQGMQANTASVMHGRFQRHSPTDIWAAIRTGSVCGLNAKCLPHTQVLLGPQPVVLSGRLWKRCNLGVNWQPQPGGEPASNLSPVTCSLHFTPCTGLPSLSGGMVTLEMWSKQTSPLWAVSAWCFVTAGTYNQYSHLKKKSHCWHNARSLSFCSLADSLIFSL